MELLTRIYYNAVYGGLGGLIGWMLYGAFGDKTPLDEHKLFQFLLLGAFIGGSIAFLVVSVEAIRDRSLARFARLSSYGVVLGSVGGALGGLIGESLKTFLAETLGVGGQAGFQQTLTSMLGFGIGWTLLGVSIGMCEGIAARSLGKFSYGTLGGALGGLVGGMLYGFFIELTRQTTEAGAYLWGALGLIIMGACIGSLTALVKAVFQPANVKVLRGWQEGREYPLDKVATLIGRHEHADIALFRDMKVEKQHCFIRRLGNRYVLFNNNAPPEHTLVNDAAIRQAIDLKDGDRIQLGNVILRFQMRAAVNRQRASRRPMAMPAQPAAAAAMSQYLQR
jgi:hypothetical protein